MNKAKARHLATIQGAPVGNPEASEQAAGNAWQGDWAGGVRFASIESLFEACERPSITSRFFCYWLIEEGECELWIDDKKVRISRHQMLLASPRMSLQLRKKGQGFRSLGICIAPNLFDAIPIGSFVYKHLHANRSIAAVFSLDDSEAIRFKQTMDLLEHYIGSAHCEETIITLVRFFLLQVTEIPAERNRLSPEPISRSDELFRHFRMLAARHYRACHSLDFYADALHVSPAYLSKVVKKFSGQAAISHVTRHILVEAQRLLTFTDLSIKEIADRLGYANQSAFGKFFKREGGLSPQQYRAKYGANGTERPE